MRPYFLFAMRRFRLIFALLAVFAAVPFALAASNSADVAHLHVQLVFPNQNLNTVAPVNAGLYFKLESGWHVYWKNAGDSGEPPHVQWTLPKGVSATPMQFPAPQRLPLGPLMDFGYANEVLYPFTVRAGATASPGSVVLHAKVDWLVCREVCIPGKAELDQNVNVVSGTPVVNLISPDDQQLWTRLAKQLPQALPSSDTAIFQPTHTGFRLAITTGQRETQAEFFPEDQDILSNPAPQIVTPTANGVILDLKQDPDLKSAPVLMTGVLELSGGRNYETAAMRSEIVIPAPSGGAASFGIASMEKMPSPGTPQPAFSVAALASTALLAFLGGLLLNLMPCVFPVLFLKGLALVNSGTEERHKLRAHGLVYTAGILVSFWALVALLLGLRAAGATLGWGFQFQSPIFLSLMAALLFFLGLSLAGQFEIGLTLTSAGGALVTKNGAAKQGYAGSFFTGVLAVIVATPCTAPLMGPAIGYALAQPAAVTFAIFTALALGLAAPYVALTLQPAWTRWLPKPGAWMDILKQAISVPIFATVIWLAWVLAQAYGAALLAALLAIFLLLAIAGWFLGRWPAKAWSAVLAGLMILSFVGLGAYSRQALVTRSSGAVAAAGAQSGEWQPWSEAAVKQCQAQGRPVFVDFTAKWCLSCQVNERVALTRPEVMKAFEDAHVALLKADWTQQDPAIAQALQSLGRNGVPAYALYPPGQGDPTLLPEALTPGIVMDAVDKLPRTAPAPAVAAASPL
jgi:thiol:disulfide interchange protein DsbD